MASQTFKGEGRIKTISNKRDLKKIISHLCLSQETARGVLCQNERMNQEEGARSWNQGLQLVLQRNKGNFQKYY